MDQAYKREEPPPVTGTISLGCRILSESKYDPNEGRPLKLIQRGYVFI